MNNWRLNPIPLGLAIGIFWGISLSVVGLLAYYFSFSLPMGLSIASAYIGSSPSVSSSLIGGLIGAGEAFIGGVIIAWLYNLFSDCCRK